MSRKLTLCFVLLWATNCFAQNALIFPVVVNQSAGDCRTDCKYWISFPTVLNPNDTETTVTFTSYDSNGNIIGASGPLSALPFREATPVASFHTGWLKVTSSQPVIGREKIQFVSQSVGATADVRSLIYLNPASVTRRHFVRPESFGPVGLSIVFPSSAGSPPAKGKFIHRDEGKIISEKEVVIPPNGQLIGFLRELLPPESFHNSPIEPFFGNLEIVFDHDVAVTALQFAASEPVEDVIVEAFSGETGSVQ
jgi:hypothetical protein